MSGLKNRIVAKRYASALFSLANEQGKLDHLRDDLQKLRSVLANDKAFSRIILSPLYSRAAHAELMEAVLASFKADKLTIAFCKTVAEQRRLAAMVAIIDAFEEALLEHRGEIIAGTSTARPLNKSKIAELEKSLSAATGKKVTIKEKNDPEILGGIVVNLGSRRFDASIRGMLLRMQHELENMPV